MNAGNIRLLVVDDSVVLRKMVESIVGTDPAIEVVGGASNGAEALEMAGRLKPDVITMDVNMPVMNGIEAVRRIMGQCPTRILMLSAYTYEGAAETFEALEAGAVDFLPKISGGNPLEIRELATAILAKIHAVAAAELIAPVPTPPAVSPPAPISVTAPAPAPVPASVSPAPGPVGPNEKIVLIGTSTGGPNALLHVVTHLPADLSAGVLVVQHMPAAFIGQLADRLDRLAKLEVKEAEEGDVVRPGRVLLAPGDSHLVLRGRNRVGLETEPSDLLHRPAVDVMLESAAEVYGSGAIGVIMTGMGEDGKKGMALLKAKGGTGIVQDEASSVVYGMPRVVVEAGLADRVCPLAKIAPAIVGCLG